MMKKIFFVLLISLFAVSILPKFAFASDGQVEYVEVRITSSLKSSQKIKLSSSGRFLTGDFEELTPKTEFIDKDEIYIVPGEAEKINILDKDGNILMTMDSKEKIYFSSEDMNNSVLKVENNRYRGYIRFQRKGNDLIVINRVTLNDYLYGVVPREMPSSFPFEALKAQAVAARNFALKNVGKYSSEGYNLSDTTDCQVYGGMDAETEITNKAVDETKGIIAEYNGELIDAVYCSNSGGITEESGSAWAVDEPYLKSIEDSFSTDSPNSVWTAVFSESELKEKLKTKGINVGDINNLEVLETSSSGRVLKLKIVGSAGEYVLEKDKIRQVLGLNDIKSTLFTIAKSNGFGEGTKEVYAVDGTMDNPKTVNLNDANVINGDSKKTVSRGMVKRVVTSAGDKEISEQEEKSSGGDFVIEGKGYGHGVGMSQWGAKKMAEEGYKFEEILKYYYNGVDVVKEDM